MNRNPYLYRNAIRNSADFFGRRAEMSFIKNRLLVPQPQSTEIVGFRRIGKSSLLHALEHSLQESSMHGHQRIIPIMVDGQELGSSGVGEFFRLIYGRLRSAGIQVPKGTPASYSGVREICEKLSQHTHLAILIDEFEVLTRNPNLTVDFFSFLRGLANNFAVAYVIASVDGIQYCQNRELAGSPFFNIFHTLNLGCFTYEEASELIRVPSERAGFSLERHENRIIKMAGLFPLFLQVACGTFFDHPQITGERGGGFESIITAFQRSIEPHFLELWKQLTPEERSVCGRLKRNEIITAELKHVVSRLVTRGVVITDCDELELFSPNFALFVGEAVKVSTAESLARRDTRDSSDISTGQHGQAIQELSALIGSIERKNGIIMHVECRPWPALNGDQLSDLGKRFRLLVSRALEKHGHAELRLMNLVVIAVFESAESAVNCGIELLTEVQKANVGKMIANQLQIRAAVVLADYVISTALLGGTGLESASKLCRSADSPMTLALSKEVNASLPKSLSSQFRPLHQSGTEAFVWDVQMLPLLSAEPPPRDAHPRLATGIIAATTVLFAVLAGVVMMQKLVGQEFRNVALIAVPIFVLVIGAVLLFLGRLEWPAFVDAVARAFSFLQHPGNVSPTQKSKKARASSGNPDRQK